ncbi:GlcG/HbpS family heme-binding protein [Azospirillum melinis]
MQLTRTLLPGLLGAGVLVGAAALALAQDQRLPYGSPIPLGQAKSVIAAAEAEAGRIGVDAAITVLDSACILVTLDRMDNTNLGGIDVSQEKARSACLFRAPTKLAEGALANGGMGLRILKLNGLMPLEGGVVLVSGGKTVGAIGVSGGSSEQDGQIARAGAGALR